MCKTREMAVGMTTVVGCLIMIGCGTMGFGEKLYEAQQLRVAATQTTLLRIVSAYATSQGWHLVNTSAEAGDVVEALSPAIEVSGMQMRNRWFFWLADNKLLIEKRLEVKFDPNEEVWQSSTAVCDTYAYENELLHLGEIAVLAQDPPSQIASNK